MADINKVIYIGVTNDLSRRLFEHKNKLCDGFTKKYNVDKLVYYELCIKRKLELTCLNKEKKV